MKDPTNPTIETVEPPTGGEPPRGGVPSAPPPPGSQGDGKLSAYHLFLYTSIAVLLVASYALFGRLFFDLYVTDSWGKELHESGRNILIAYIWGAIGGTTASSVYLAKEANAHRSGDGGTPYPNILEPFGYVVFIVGSGFCGVLLFGLINAGFIAAYQESDSATISDMALLVISFIGGFSADRVKGSCKKLGKGIMKDVNQPHENAGNRQEPGENSQ